MKKLLLWRPRVGTLVIVGFFAATLTFSNVALAFTGSGAGTVGNPYQITTCEELQEMNDELGANYVLVNNIDCAATTGWNSGAGFEPVGTGVSPFTGSLDGQGNIITGLFIGLNTNGVGLFGDTSDTAEIRNVGLVNVDVTGTTNVGGLVGSLRGTVENTYVTGAVEGTQNAVGGLVGNHMGDITDSYSTASITNSGSGGGTGGLVGYMIFGSSGDTITRSYATGAVISTSITGSVGGLVGEHQVGSITDSYATGSVEGASHVGGLVGYSYGSTISNSYATGSVIGSGARVGGFIGTNDGSEISGSYALGNVTGQRVAGGFVGANTESPGVITDSYARGSVTGLGSFGNDSGIGGFAGRSPGIISRSFSTGAVNGSSNQNVGGFVGSLGNTPGTIEDSFWDTQASGQATSVGGTGKTSAEMKTISTFSDDNFDIQTTVTSRNDGYPFFSWEIGDTSPVWYISATPTDGDGISDAVEDAAPNSGDGNNDGTADSQQAHVVSFVNTVTGKYVTLEVDSACTITAAGNTAESANTAHDSGFDYPVGLMNFTLDCGTPGFTATVAQYYHGVSNDGYVLRKHNPTTHAYFGISGATITQTTIGGQTVTKATYQVTDGSSLDVDGQANGTIVDPAGLALNAVGVPNTGLGGSWN